MDSTVGRWNRRNGGVCRQIALANTLEDVIKMARLPTKAPIPPHPLTIDIWFDTRIAIFRIHISRHASFCRPTALFAIQTSHTVGTQFSRSLEKWLQKGAGRGRSKTMFGQLIEIFEIFEWDDTGNWVASMPFIVIDSRRLSEPFAPLHFRPALLLIALQQFCLAGQAISKWQMPQPPKAPYPLLSPPSRKTIPPVRPTTMQT